jgi:uroporphyrinogen decarboxylase
MNHKEPDQIPLDLGVGRACMMHVRFYKKLVDHLGIKEENPRFYSETGQTVRASDEVVKALGNDFRRIDNNLLPNPENRPVVREEDEENHYITTAWGEKMRMPKDGGLYYDSMSFPLEDAEDEEDDEKYQWIIPGKADPADLQRAVKYCEDGYSTMYAANISLGFLHTGNHVYGFENWLAILAAEPERAAKFNKKLLEKKIEWWDDKISLFGDSVDVVCEGDDLGTQKGPFISTKMWKNLILPYMKELFEFIRGKNPNLKILFHSDGSFLPMIPDLIDIGLDCLNPVQFSAAGMDLASLKREFGKDLTFWGGGVDVQNTLPNGTPQQVKDEVTRNIELLRKDGGFVFAATHNIQPDVPIENFMAVLEAFKENCKY